MNISRIFPLLGLAAFGLRVAAQDVVEIVVWPPGPEVYPGEAVLLQCRVKLNSTSAWSYEWYKHNPSTLKPSRVALGDKYSIMAIKREDMGNYWCKAEREPKNPTTNDVLTSYPVLLRFSELPPPSLILTPNKSQLFEGEKFTVQCPASQPNSTGWKLRHYYSQGHAQNTTDFQTDQCLPLGGAVSTSKSNVCVFTATSKNSGLYWCEGTKVRSSTVNITVSCGICIKIQEVTLGSDKQKQNITLKTPNLSVFEGDRVILYCQYQTGNYNKITFFKNGSEVMSFNSSGSDRIVNMTIENVTQNDEGLYKCADPKMESAEIWLSVRPNQGNITTTNGTAASTSGVWKWILLSCGLVSLFLIPLSVWLICHYRYQLFCTQSCWPLSKEDVPAVRLPATKQDATEVQWDLSWMEMSSLLDKHLYPGS